MSNTFDKLSVLDSFIEEVNSYLPEIETNLERLTQFAGDMDALEETYRRTHTIGGSASMMDFPGLAHVAHGMEDILGDALDGLTSLDQHTLALLRRSLGRLRLLLEGIRNGTEDDRLVAEDDSDYSQYRSLQDTNVHHAQGLATLPPYPKEMENEPPAFPPRNEQFIAPPPQEEVAIPTFDEVLASFRTPSTLSEDDLSWPEDTLGSLEALPAVKPQQFSPNPLGSTNLLPDLQIPPTPVQENSPELPSRLQSGTRSSSVWDELEALMTQAPLPQQSSPVTPAQPQVPLTPTLPAFEEPFPQEEASADSWQSQLSPQFLPEEPLFANNTWGDNIVPQEPEMPPPFPLPLVAPLQQLSAVPAMSPHQFPAVYTDLQQESLSLAEQAQSLKHVIDELRSASTVIETQRREFKGFLDGSKDALERMEDWAGQAMGLNLRNSPEHVRRYLPLSVMWVANSKLKKVLDHLQHITSGVELTDGQMVELIRQLRHSIQSCGETFEEMQVAEQANPNHNPTWTPWEVQTSQEPQQLRERITFERQGDLKAIRSELEAEIRAEVRHEYETRPIVQAMRAEIEKQVRDEIAAEAASRPQPQIVAPPSIDVDELRRSLEARVRNEIEIQVRREFLEQINKAGGLPNTNLEAEQVAPKSEAVSLPPLSPTPAAPIMPPMREPGVSTPAFGDFGEEAAEIFREEAEEHLQTISINVAALEKKPDDLNLIQGIRRATHTLKGAAGMMGFRAIADLTHISEDLLDSIMEGHMTLTSDVVSLILDTAEVLEYLISGKDAEGISDEARVDQLRARYAALLGNHAGSMRGPTEEDLIDADEVPIESSHVTEVVEGQTGIRGSQGDLSVRVRLQKIDELVNLFGEILVNRSVLDERVQRLARLVADIAVSSNRLSDVGQKLESRFEAATLPSGRSVQVMPGDGSQSRLLPPAGQTSQRNGAMEGSHPGKERAHFSDFDELELDRYTEFHQWTRGLSESISDVGTLSTELDTVVRECEGVLARENRLTTTFQDRLMKVRLIPLSAMAPRLYRAARRVALKQHKEINFVIEGETTEVDRTVYEEITGPLLHLVRNAVNHAIEVPQIRQQKGKAIAGLIKTSAAYEGNQIVITVRDDGMGIDPESVRQTAISRGLIRPDQVLSEGDLIDLIFRPGFSTAEFLSEESGRGVGLDVVRDSVSRLRGTLVVESTPGQGTAFTMTFPTSLAIQSAMTVMVSGQQFAVPTVSVDTISRLDSLKRTTSGGQPAVVLRNDTYPLRHLAEYLALPVYPVDEKAQLLLVTAAGQRIALVVDEIKGKSDIVMKNLGPHLRQIHGIAGGTILGNGHVVLVLELNDLLAVRSRTTGRIAPVLKRETSAQPAIQMRQRIEPLPPTNMPVMPVLPANNVTTPQRGKHILVVDDSPSVRRVVSNMLKQHHWEVQTARDGVEALEMVAQETPAAILLDIEMPRMDGYELISTIRAQDQYKTLPLIVLTSRAASKHQQRAVQLGASSYVVKPYQDEELLNILSTLVYGTSSR